MLILATFVSKGDVRVYGMRFDRSIFMKVLYVDHSPKAGGAAKVMVRLLGMLRNDGVSPVIACSEGSDLGKALHDSGFQTYAMPMPWLTKKASVLRLLSYIFYLFSISYRISRVIWKEDIKIMHANTFIASLYCVVPAIITRRPLIWHMHDILEAGLVNKLFIRISGYYASKIICVSEAVKSHLVEFGVAPQRCVVIYNSVQPTENSREYGRFRKELDINENVLLAGLIAFITKWKGQVVLIKAIPEVIKDFPDAKFVIVGDIMLESDRCYMDSLYRLVREYGIREHVIFTGHRPDILDIMTDLDVVVHTSILPDPLPTVVLEAMSVGKPIIASNSGGTPEMIENGANGYLITPNDPKELARAIVELFKDRALRDAMGDEGIKMLKKRFQPEENLKKIKDVYSEVAV